jgi:hypothetical protein
LGRKVQNKMTLGTVGIRKMAKPCFCLLARTEESFREKSWANNKEVWWITQG